MPIYSVISPEGAASILWRDGKPRAQDAATNIKVTSDDMMRLGIIDEIIPEPVGGAHRDPAAAIAATGKAIERACAIFRGSTETQSGASGGKSSSISAKTGRSRATPATPPRLGREIPVAAGIYLSFTMIMIW